MWFEFFIACLAGCAFILVPGYLLARALCIHRATALALSPCFSIAAYALLGIAYLPAGVTCSWVVVAAPVFALGALAFIVRCACDKGIPQQHYLAPASSRRNSGVLAAYLLIAGAATIYIYLSVLDSPLDFSQEFDNLFHLSLVEQFAESGKWSSLSVSLYADPLSAADNPTPNLAAYPAAWHVVAALICSLFGVSASFAVNVANVVFIAAVFPLGMQLLMRILFPENMRVQLAGAVSCVAIPSFPWRLLWWGPIYPNLAAFCLIPAVMALFIMLTSRGYRRFERLCAAAFILIGGVSVVLLQPNGVFSMVIFLAPYCTARVYAECRSHWPHPEYKKRAVGFAVLFALVVVAVWLGIYGALSGMDVLGYTWDSLMPVHEGIMNVLLLNYCYTPWIPALAVLILLGAFHVVRSGPNRWLAFSYVLVCAMLITCLSGEGEIKHIVGGFWYTDQMRLAALAALFAMPLAAAGFDALISLAQLACTHLPVSEVARTRTGVALCSVVTLVLLIAITVPYELLTNSDGSKKQTGVGSIRDTLAWSYTKHETWYYTEEEEAFVQTVHELYPDAKFINMPFDGSCWAFGADGLDVFYRYFDVYGYNLESAESKALRNRLDRVAYDEDVQEAVKAMGVPYVIKLDERGVSTDNFEQWMYRAVQWYGITTISEDTPGFELVLSEGDMSLYRITVFDDEEGSESS